MLDKCLGAGGSAAAPAPAPAMPRPGPMAPGTFDFYVLALSWSPGFCDTGGARKAQDQCAPGAGLGFVVHGLWPQNEHGYPADCGDGGGPPHAALATVRDLYPSLGLAVHEWRSHGACTGLPPASYFAAVRRARDAVKIPPDFQRPTEPRTVAPREIVRAFAGSNPGLRADTMAIACRSGELEEVRLCLAKDLRGFVPCPEVARSSCRSPSLDVLPVE